MGTTAEAAERRGAPEDLRPTATLQFRIADGSVPWIYASAMKEPLVLFDNEFPDPFESLRYVIAGNANGQIILTANLHIGKDFIQRYGQGIGLPEDLQPFTRRYDHEFAGGNNEQLVLKKDDQPQGMIARVDEDRIIIQLGGSAGGITLSDNTPINDLTLALNRFNKLVQDYVQTIWRADKQTDQKKIQLVLSIPQVPEGAGATYFSTFEIVGREYEENPRKVDLEKDIGGFPSLKDQIQSLVVDVGNPDVSRSFGTDPQRNKSVLVCGEEGTGKTLFVKALDRKLRERFGRNFEHFRLQFRDILRIRGRQSGAVVQTVLNHIEENEKKGLTTLLHLDDLEALTPEWQHREGGPSHAEIEDWRRTGIPVINVLRDFGRKTGANAKHIVIFGESRVPREYLPGDVAKIFRPTHNLYIRTPDDYKGMLLVHIQAAEKLAEGSGHDPFVPDILTSLSKIAPYAFGLVGKDIRDAFESIARKKKAEWEKKKTYLITTVDDIIAELGEIRLAKGIKAPKKRIGFLED